MAVEEEGFSQKNFELNLSIFDQNDKKIRCEAIIYDGDLLVAKLKARKNLSLPLKYNSEFRVEFINKAYYAQSVLINTLNIPKHLQKESLDLDLKITLIKKQRDESEPLEPLFVEQVLFDFENNKFVFSNAVLSKKQSDKILRRVVEATSKNTRKYKRKDLLLAKKQLELDRLEVLTTADSLSLFEREAEILAAENEILLKERELEQIQMKLERKELLLEQERLKKQMLIFGIIIMLLFVVVLYKSVKDKKRKNKVILKQKKAIEDVAYQLKQKNKEIIYSITYAKRIQSAILPPHKTVKDYLVNSFIIYEPKDIVAGDFYWMVQKQSKIIFAAADCTGHGVPGAMVSVICNNALNRSVREYNLTNPAEILDKTREIFIEEFDASEEELKDGMDIALCTLEGNTLEYAGSNNPLWLIRNNELIEIKANKQPVGKFIKPKPYINHTIELQKGDTFYIFSDGYVDQFGGEKGKKFKSSNFKRLLLSIQNEPMNVQKKILQNNFSSWKGDLDQLDDVCVIGVRV